MTAETAADRAVAHPERNSTASGQVLASSLLSLVATAVAIWPYGSAIRTGPWLPLALLLLFAVVGIGFLVRLLLRHRSANRGNATALVAQLAAGIGVLTLSTMASTALLGLIPTVDTVSTFASLARQASWEIMNGYAPLEDTLALRTAFGAGFLVLGILIDQLVALRVNVLAVVLIAAVGAVPMIITISDPDLIWFFALALITLLLLRHGSRGSGAPRPFPAPLALTAGIGVVAIISSFLLTPAIPLSTTLFGFGTGSRIDPTLRLGEDLRRPEPFEILTVTTKGEAPYLRVATLSSFDGDTWKADAGGVQALSAGFGPRDWDGDIPTVSRDTEIDITALSGSWLPVPYAATEVSGLEGRWTTMPSNRTVTTSTADTDGQQYTVVSEEATPTSAQLAASSARSPGTDAVDMDAIPSVISTTAQNVTAGASSDYEKLVALQDWFRTEFDYSLDTPVEEGFDGDGADAVERFLEVRAGYCVHFSGAFALMAQTMQMDARIVVGYLPGRPDGMQDGLSRYAVDSDGLHAWPEVFFDGIGWVPFEPTASLGQPAAFVPEPTDEETPESAAPSEAPSTTAPQPSASPEAPALPEDETTSTDAPTDAGGGFALSPWLLLIPGVILALLLPAIMRVLIRARRSRQAARGDIGAAWRELRATMIDIGLPVEASDTPRQRGAILVGHGADRQATDVLTTAVERASYAGDDSASTDVTAVLRTVLTGILTGASPGARRLATFLPRSLLPFR